MFTKEYPFMLNAKHQFIIHTNHKILVGFHNAEYYKDIIARWANKLYLLNICIKYILWIKNMVADSLSWVIINNFGCFFDQLVNKLAKEVFLYQDNNKSF